jgi:DNA-binding GntR family transcriptional regulator
LKSQAEEGKSAVATAYKTMQEIVYDTIREAIQIGRYAPGQRLVADDLAQELGTSRMPVREALRRLEVAGLVSITPHRGAIVSELSAKEIVEIYHIRAVLEGLATRLAAPQLTPADFDHLNAAIAAMAASASDPDLDQMLRRNREFHITIWEAAHAGRLQELLENLYDASHRYRNISILLPGRLAQVIQEHRQIVQALTAGDVASAERLANEHHANTAQRLLVELEKIKTVDS